MAGLMMVDNWGVKAENLLASVKTSSSIQTKMSMLLKLKEVLLRKDSTLLPEFVPLLAELHDDLHSPVRRLLAEIIGEVGSKHIELLPEMVPTLILFLKDEAPAVTRQAISSGTLLFHVVIEKIAIEGLHSPQIDTSMAASWECMLNFKEAVSHIVLQPGIDGVRVLAIKFLEEMILLYTPDPNGSSSPSQEAGDDVNLESVFNVSWLRGGHSILKAGDLSIVASQSLGVLLDQLRFPQVKSLSNSIIMVLISCLSAIAKKRPSFYGRILPVLLSLDPSNAIIRGVNVPGAYHALKHAFSAFLKCTHTGAAPWRDRVVEALKKMNAGKILEQAAPAYICGSELDTDNSSTVKDEPSMSSNYGTDGGQARKRIKLEETDELTQEDDMPTKRAKQATATTFEEIAGESFHDKPDKACNDVPLNDMSYPEDDGNGPVHQLVGVFGALAAQGDRASDSLNILISSTSSDLLAEVVLANMCHLPPPCLKTEKESDLILNMTSIIGSTKKDQSMSPATLFVSSILSLSRILSSLLNVKPPTCDTSTFHLEGEQMEGTTLDTNMYSSNLDKATSGILDQSCHEGVPQSESIAVVSSDVNDVVSAEDQIPGLGLTIDQVDSIDGSLDISNVELQGEIHEQNISLGCLMPETTSSGSISTCVLEANSVSGAYMDTVEAPSTALNLISSSKLFALPKMTTSVIELDDEQKDDLHKNAYLRVIGAFKQIYFVGGTNILFSLLGCLGVECPLDLEVWGLLQKHILSDYVNHEGHELTLRVLYRLFRESEQDQDFFSSTTATADYDKFLLTVAENLLDLFPSSDKSLSKLLCEAPYLPKSVLKLLERLCCPGGNEKDVKDFQGGDRVTQGLIAVWNVITQRPPNREACLKIALQSAVHHLEEVRMKAIRLVANKLFPMSSNTRAIEDFANEMLLSVVHILPASEDANAGEQLVGSNMDIGPEMGESKVSSSEISAHPHHPSSALLSPFSSVSEAQRRMSLYFALCTKKHSLLQRIFAIYNSMPNSAKEAIQGHIPILVRTTGASGELLSIISDPPAGSQGLLMQVLHTLTDGSVPSQELLSSVKMLYDTKLKDVEILIPVLSSLSKHEIFAVFPQIIDLSPDKFQDALSRILKGSTHSGPVLTPEEVLIAIHGIDPEKDGVALKKVMDACTSCFEQRQLFTQQVLAKALNQLVEQIPLPLLFMRTVIQAVGAFPALVDFVMEILSRLVNKQIWKYPKLWVGFLKCAVQTKPQSFNVLLQLPATQLENALKKNPILKAPISEHANQPNFRQSLPRSTLVVLGLAQDLQTSGAAQTSQTIVAETSNSMADANTEPTQDSASVS